MPIEKFAVPYSEDAVRDLRERLARTRWPDTIPGSGWTYGFDLAYLQRICEYWREHFDWKALVEELSQLEHFRYTTGDDAIHFVRMRGEGNSPTPILLLHGWPGSFLEMLKLGRLLAKPTAHGSFDVIIGSLPGFGFSSRPTASGMNTARMADLFAQLMRELGYERFACHGGDFGASVSSWLARRHPEQIIGIHLNYIPGYYRPAVADGEKPTPEERQFLDSCVRWEEQWGAYDHIQIRTPQTAAYGLNDSPAALAAWILEKFRDWADCDGDLEKRFTWDQLLANVTLYWMTETIHSSCRLYFESIPLQLERGEQIAPPCGIAHFAKEAPFPPRSWIDRGYNVQHWTDFASGGHFAAMEEPYALAGDIREFFSSLRSEPTPLEVVDCARD
jgi:pimeloyl-ACP methyl ester carboxylesterase